MNEFVISEIRDSLQNLGQDVKPQIELIAGFGAGENGIDELGVDFDLADDQRY